MVFKGMDRFQAWQRDREEGKKKKRKKKKWGLVMQIHSNEDSLRTKKTSVRYRGCEMLCGLNVFCVDSKKYVDTSLEDIKSQIITKL